MPPWLFFLALLFGYGSTLFCYKGQYRVFRAGSPQFDPFYKVECPERQSCARYQSARSNPTVTFYNCAKRCRGSIECCRTDLCNDKWMAQYQNLTRKVKKIVVNPAAKNSDVSEMKIDPSRVRWVRPRAKAAQQFKSLQLDEKNEDKQEPEPNNDNLILLAGIAASVGALSLVASVVICAIGERYSTRIDEAADV